MRDDPAVSDLPPNLGSVGLYKKVEESSFCASVAGDPFRAIPCTEEKVCPTC